MPKKPDETTTLPEDPTVKTIQADDDDEMETPVLDTPVFYDARKPQRIALKLTKNGIDYPLHHLIEPLTDERYFAFQLEMEERLGKGDGVNTDMIFGPKHRLWKELVTGREGYVERDDWKEKTHYTDANKAIDYLISILLTDIKKSSEETDGELLFDDDALTTIPFSTMYNGINIQGMSHSFRQETKAEMDAFMAIENGEANPNELASAEKVSMAERYCRLGRKMIRGNVGYESGSPIPAWHLAGTTRAFFLRQLGRMGKS